MILTITNGAGVEAFTNLWIEVPELFKITKCMWPVTYKKPTLAKVAGVIKWRYKLHTAMDNSNNGPAIKLNNYQEKNTEHKKRK